MKTKDNNKRSHSVWQHTALNKKLLIFVLIASATSLHAQVTRPAWWFGAAAGANFNFYRGSTQKLNNELTVPAAFHNGNGAGLYLAPMAEYLRPGARWGIMLQAAYDGRSSDFKQINTPCNCPADLSAKLSYITVEPSFRFAPFKSGLYLYVGPRLAFNVAKSFTYEQKANPDYPEQTDGPAVKGDFSDVQKMLVSMQIGAGYDIPVSASEKRTQFVISPFISFKPYFGQSPRSVETWNITTLTAGAAFKFGVNRKNPVAAGAGKEVRFSVNSPKNLPTALHVRETFPLRNYIFFNSGSTEIPNRYVLLKKSQVKDFKEDQLEVSKPKSLSGRSKRQMVAYYNVLNILGDRMQKNPSSAIVLAGSSEEGPEDGKAMAESVKKYLVDVFAIEPSRITTEGRTKPKVPDVHAGAAYELDLLREGDRRVTVESSSPALLAEFQSGPAQAKSETGNSQEAPPESYVSFTIEEGKDAISSWSVEVADEKGKVQNFGPYTEKTVSIPGKSILGTRTEGDYKITMTGKTPDGKTVTKETTAHVTLWTPAKNEEGMKYSVIFEFNESKVSAAYQKYLTDIVIPKIPKDGTVIIQGYTDVIGDEKHNKELSLERAQDIRNILEKGLQKSGRKDVKFEVSGSGEDENLSPFENKYPEERFYNRTVVIDVIPNM